MTYTFRCPVIGTGTGEDPFRPSIADVLTVAWWSVGDERADPSKVDGAMLVQADLAADELAAVQAAGFVVID